MMTDMVTSTLVAARADIAVMTVFMAILFAGALMDLFWLQVYDMLWVIAIIFLSIFIFIKGEMSVDLLAGLIVYFTAQEVFMKKAYGKADCHALCCCALFLAYFGCGLLVYALHLGIVLFLLIVKNLFSGNVSRNMTLKKPVPMIPYIFAGLCAVSSIYVP